MKTLKESELMSLIEQLRQQQYVVIENENISYEPQTSP